MLCTTYISADTISIDAKPMGFNSCCNVSKAIQAFNSADKKKKGHEPGIQCKLMTKGNPWLTVTTDTTA